MVKGTVSLLHTRQQKFQCHGKTDQSKCAPIGSCDELHTSTLSTSYCSCDYAGFLFSRWVAVNVLASRQTRRSECYIWQLRRKAGSGRKTAGQAVPTRGGHFQLVLRIHELRNISTGSQTNKWTDTHNNRFHFCQTIHPMGGGKWAILRELPKTITAQRNCCTILKLCKQ